MSPVSTPRWSVIVSQHMLAVPAWPPAPTIENREPTTDDVPTGRSRCVRHHHAIARRRGDRGRRHHRHLNRIVPGREGPQRRAVREGPDRRRAIQSQLGLVPHHGPRRPRDPAGAGKPAAVARHERAHRPGNRIPPGRHRLPVRNRTRSRGAGSLAGPGPRIPGRSAAASRRRRQRPGSRRHQALCRRPAHTHRRPRRAVPRRARDRRGRPRPRRHHPDRLRRARHRPPGRARRRCGDGKGPHRLRRRGAGRRRLVALVLRQHRHRPAAVEIARLGVPNGAAARRAGGQRLRQCVRLAQAAGRRLHHRPPQRQHR